MKSRVLGKSEVAKAVPEPETRRLNLNLSQKAYDDLAVLSKQHQRSMTEIIRLGLGLAKIVLDAAENGDKMLIADKDGKALKEIVLP